MNKKITSSKKDDKIILLGNNAIVRGALESGVQFVSTYPGTPSSEVGNTFYKIARKEGVYFEYSTNEKVALEAATGASFCGLKTLVAMKHFGLNVASDFFMPLVNAGVPSPMVVFVADDPSCWSSAQSEENTRAFATLAHVPILEPSTPQEAKDFTKLAFELSDKLKIPVMIRHTTRVSHQSSPVILGEKLTGGGVLGKLTGGKTLPQGKFKKDPEKFSTMPPRVLKMKGKLLQKIDETREISEESDINYVVNKESSSNLGIITSGVSFLHTMEGLAELELNCPVLKLGFYHPLPEEKIKQFIAVFDKVLIVEELEPYLEEKIKALAKEANPDLEIFGKSHLPQIGELKPEYLIKAISNITSKEYSLDFKSHLEKFQKLDSTKRSPQLCPGCPYWPVFSIIKKIAPPGTIFGGGIGCYMLAAFPPHQMQDYVFSMGSSVGIAHGIKKSTYQKLITFIGDSSFFHAGIPALINTVYNNSNPLIIVMDNRVTAMTGQQPNPGTGKNGMGEDRDPLDIEKIVRACGVKHVKTIDPHKNLGEFRETLKDFLEKDEVSVIVAKHPCKYYARKFREK